MLKVSILCYIRCFCCVGDDSSAKLHWLEGVPFLKLGLSTPILVNDISCVKQEQVLILVNLSLDLNKSLIFVMTVVMASYCEVLSMLTDLCLIALDEILGCISLAWCCTFHINFLINILNVKDLSIF